MSANDSMIGGSHYHRGGKDFQHWDLVEVFGLGYLEGCATKYLVRWRDKNGLQDVQKALHYSEKLLEIAKSGERKPRGFVPAHPMDTFLSSSGITDESERGAIYILCRWKTYQDLELAIGCIQQIIERAERDARTKYFVEEFRPGTPEDGGHHARQQDS